MIPPSSLCRLQPPPSVAAANASAVTFVASRWVTTVYVTTLTWRPPADLVLSVATPPFATAFSCEDQSAALVVVTDVAPRRRPSAAFCWRRVFVVLGDDLLTWSGNDLVAVRKDQRGRAVRVSTFHWPPYVGTATPQTALTQGLEVANRRHTSPLLSVMSPSLPVAGADPEDAVREAQLRGSCKRVCQGVVDVSAEGHGNRRRRIGLLRLGTLRRLVLRGCNHHDAIHAGVAHLVRPSLPRFLDVICEQVRDSVLLYLILTVRGCVPRFFFRGRQ